MKDERVWVPVEVIWDEDLWRDDPWRGDRRGRPVESAARHRAQPEYDWSQGWQPERDAVPDDNWGREKPTRHDGGGLSKRKRKKLRGRDPEEWR